jgi:hypothetical protein
MSLIKKTLCGLCVLCGQINSYWPCLSLLGGWSGALGILTEANEANEA